MAGNTFGKNFKISTAGESHGPAMIVIIDGCPAKMELSVADIQVELDRRRPGKHRFTSQRQELDQVEILSGLFEGQTTGTPIALMIKNTNQRPADYEAFKEAFRPGHADYGYQLKYGIRDHRGGGRSSARETALWVGAGAIAKKYLAEIGVNIFGYLSQVGDYIVPFTSAEVIDHNPFFVADVSSVQVIEDKINHIRKQGNSIGSEVTVVAQKVPPGLGEPVFEKLDAKLAQAMMSINAVKAVEIGSGTEVVTQTGAEHRDSMSFRGFASNHAGGIIGGISTGQDIQVKLSIKPTSSIPTPIQTINALGQEQEIKVKGRHDPCIGIRAVPIAEAMMAIVLFDQYLNQRARQPNWIQDNAIRGEHEKV